jgi:hypothetical protein
MNVRPSSTIDDEEDATMSEGADVGVDGYGAGIPDDWWTIQRWATGFDHGQTPSAARNFLHREIAAGRITEWHEPFGPRGGKYLDAEQRAAYLERLVEGSRRTAADLRPTKRPRSKR